MGTMRYKPSDKVRIKSLDWYNMHCDDAGNVDCGCEIFEKDMKPYLGKVFTIHRIVDNSKYEMEEAFDFFLFTDEMIEGLVEEEKQPKFKVGDEVRIKGTDIGGTIESIIRGQLIVNSKGSKIPAWSEDVVLMKSVEEETKPNIIEEAKTYWDSIKDAWICPDDYIFKDENGNVINATKIVLEKKKKEYPKTYEECIGKLPINWDGKVEGYKCDLLTTFQKLLICRDAYWKLAGEEMGLGKPWESDNDYSSPPKYIISCYFGDIIKEKYCGQYNRLLSFPTEEMRDAFKENFDPDIEICKELL